MKEKVLIFILSGTILFLFNNFNTIKENFLNTQINIKQSVVKGNMQVFQNMLETYAVDWKGQYPKNINTLSFEAKRKKYWKSFRNPYDGTYYSIQDFLGEIKKERRKNYYIPHVKGGVVIYAPEKINDKKITRYYIYGTYSKNNSDIFDFINNFPVFNLSGENSWLLSEQSGLLYLTNN